MYQYFLDVLDKLCPEKTFKEVRSRNDWISSPLFEIMLLGDQMFREAKAKKDSDKLTEARQLRNTVNEAYKYAKGDFIKQY